MKIPSCLLFLSVTAIVGCQKNLDFENKVSSGSSSDYSTNGVVTAQVSVLPPVTFQTFIPNIPGGNVSYTGYDVSASKHIFIDYFQINASYPLINVIGGVPNTNGQTAVSEVYSINAGQSVTIPLSILYNNVDSTNTPAIATCRLSSINYHTDDYTPYTLAVDKTSGSAFSMCLVNNKPHINFVSPAQYQELNNGYVEMADIAITGDTSWTLNTIPVNFYFPDFSYGTYPSKLLLKYNGAKIGSALITSGHTKTITIANGFKHLPGQTDTLKLYGYNMHVNLPSFFVTELGNLNGLSWVDGLGGLVSGSLNVKYFKEETGSASLYNH